MKEGIKRLGQGFLFILILILLIGVFVSRVDAAKKRVKQGSYPMHPGVSFSLVRLSRPTHSAVINFINLDKVTEATYNLSYSANGIAQGAAGTLFPKGQTSTSRDLYFGTCSKGVCTPHFNIRNATLVISVNLTTGGTFTKRYRLRV